MKKLDNSHKALLICVFAFIIYIAASCTFSFFSFERTDVSDREPLAAATEDESPAQYGGEPVNINTAGKYELERLPGVSEATARKIIEFREEYGAFESAEEIMLVSGIGEKKFEAMREYITVD
ncbi:MAG: helix-hairpin-helix domain-containing protein [Clostridia bacterium]|nr:helix-hairpin-helix domain-containing protein [Clostridia bacterium]